jgi:NAD(P)-dependent dehydrogenase (short-subunit alcohol dehydrogenase family)
MNQNNNYANSKKFNPENSICVVTGGSSGIGAALIKELIKRKAKKVINLDIKNNKLRDIDFFKCNVGDNLELEKALKIIHEKYKNIDLFCSNAGVAKDDDGLASVEHWNKIWKINVLQHTNAVRNCIPKMLENNSGWFLITASAAGLLSQVGSATYSTTKHAAVGFAEWLSITYGNNGIGVSLLCPQGVNTSMTENIENGGVAGINGMLEPEDVAKISLDQMALGKFLITPHEIVKKYIKIKAEDTDKWILGMRKLYKKYVV